MYNTPVVMAARAPKQWSLTKHETITTFENWRQNLVYTLALDANFAPFLGDDCKWGKRARVTPLRGFKDDTACDGLPADQRRTAHQKVSMLELMLGQIANFCPVISRNAIVKDSTCLSEIWTKIRLHYGFQSTGAHFLDFAEMKLEADERPEDLYQRLVAFVEDNLLTASGGISHHGDLLSEDEEMSPSLENFIVLQWLSLVHVELPRLVKQRYGTELRSRTLASLKPEISQALDSLLEEIRSVEQARSMRTSTPSVGQQFRRGPGGNRPKPFTGMKSGPSRVCPLCKQAGRPYKHFLSTCQFLPEQDKRYLAKVRQISSILEDCDVFGRDDAGEYECESESDEQCTVHTNPHTITHSDHQDTHASAKRVQIRQSPYFDAFCGHNAIRLTVDTGATANMIRLSTVQNVKGKIKASSQSAHQADGSSPLNVVGETSLVLSRDGHKFSFQGLVVEDLDVEVLAGAPFMERNDVHVRPARHEINIGDCLTITYGSSRRQATVPVARRAVVLRAPPKTTVVFPGDFLETEVPPELQTSEMIAIEPRMRHNSDVLAMWPLPGIVANVGGRVRIPNFSEDTLMVKRNEQFCQARSAICTGPNAHDHTPEIIPPVKAFVAGCAPHSQNVALDPDNILPAVVRSQFQSLHEQYDSVFDPEFKGYNGSAGHFESVVNMGPVQPPQRKGRLPLYARSDLVKLQEKFDELEVLGVFARPEDMDISVEYLNPSFLVKKPAGGHRLVTAFADVGRYAKPQPSLLPDVDSTLRKIGQWKFLITTDLTSAFYQIPLSKASMKYCGVATPFRGVRVYTRSAMGMPGSETALEELMCRVLGDLLKQGIVVKLADDLYCGGDTPQELLANWAQVLGALHDSDLRLSARKTVICPKTASILGWSWRDGNLKASPHRISALSQCDKPSTVKGLRSFIGAYKTLSRVLPHCATLVAPLDGITAGQQSGDTIVWTDDRAASFKAAQDALTSSQTITLPHPHDQLWLVTDGAVKKFGIGATLYVTRNDKPHVAGFFSAKLSRRHNTWLPCEVEALSIASAVKHFSPYLVQSHHPTAILTDSKPCVQAFEKLCRGEFSASPRVSTFLSTVSRFHCTLRHLLGSANVPSDFASRNAPECLDPACQVCSFVRQMEECTVLRTTTEDVLSGHTKLPYTSRSVWMGLQHDCPDLRRAHAYLRQGTRPSKKLTTIRDVKRYLQVASIAKDGLLVVRRDQLFLPSRDCIVVPRGIVDGLLTSLHLQLSHPSFNQLKAVVNRYFYALDMDAALHRITSACHQCASLRTIPPVVTQQSTSDPPEVVGISFAADVIRRARQLILLLRETTTSYTATCFIDDERHGSLRDGLIRLCVGLHPLDGPPAVVRTDAAPGFRAILNDQRLKQLRISLEIGDVKNPNKNPVAEHAIRELEDEMLRMDPSGGPMSAVDLSVATARLNARVRTRGLSAREMWFQRDQFTGDQLPISDADLIIKQHELRLSNHSASARSKVPSGRLPPLEDIEVGDIIYLRSDRDKSHTRFRYLVTSRKGNWCDIQKFSGSQLRGFSYHVKTSDCVKVPSSPSLPSSVDTGEKSASRYDKDDDPIPSAPHPPPPHPPDIPLELSEPFTPDISSPISLKQSPILPQRRSTRERRPPPYLGDYELN